MEISINIEDYVSEQDIRDEALKTIGESFKEQFKKEADVERVLSNLSHEYIFQEVVKYLEIDSEEVEKRIREGIAKALSSESNTIVYKVFQRADAWDRTESPAVKILDDVLKDSRPKIEECVNKIIEEYPFRELREEIEDTIYDCIVRKLQEKRKDDAES